MTSRLSTVDSPCRTRNDDARVRDLEGDAVSVSRRAVLAGFTAIGSQAAAGVRQLSLTIVSGQPSASSIVEQLRRTFMPAVDAALVGSGEAVVWTESFGRRFGSPGRERAALVGGRAQIGLVSTAFEPDVLPLQSLTFAMPFGTADTRFVLETMARLHSEVPGMAESWLSEGLVYLGGCIVLDNHNMVSTFPVATLDDLAGRRIAGPPAVLPWLGGTRAVAVPGNAGTIRAALAEGSVDGAIVPATTAATMGLLRWAPHFTVTDFGAQYAGSLVARRAWFEAQSNAMQSALVTGALRYRDCHLAGLTPRMKDAVAMLEGGQARVSALPLSERARWAAGLPDLPGLWLLKAETAGLPGRAVLDSYLRAQQAAGVKTVRDWSLR